MKKASNITTYEASYILVATYKALKMLGNPLFPSKRTITMDILTLMSSLIKYYS